jgi:hypothetical protein
MASTCPTCTRPVAVARPRCLYCGADLPAGQVPAAEGAAMAATAPAPPPSERQLVILSAGGAPRDALAAALALSPFEAELRVRRGGYQLHRVAHPEAAAQEAGRLRAAGLSVEVVPELEAREAARPWMVLGGRRQGLALALRGEDGSAREVQAAALLLIVRGPIARALEGAQTLKRVRVAGPAEGQRVHLHLLGGERPLELDPEAFEMDAGAGVATALLSAWLRELAGVVPVDEAFAHHAPALAPATAATVGAAAAAQALAEARKRKGDQGLLLDNVAQFRFYSGWRAAVERRRRKQPLG